MPQTLQRQTDSLRDERQGPFTAAGFLLMLVAIAVAVVVTFVLVRRPQPIALPTGAGVGAATAAHSAAELVAPTVRMPEELIVSVPAAEGSTDYRTAVLSVDIKLGKAEGREEEDLDVDYLNKVYVPKVRSLLPWIRHELRNMVVTKPLARLGRPETQTKIADDLKQKINDRLHSHGMEKRVREVYWHSFHFD